MLCLGQTLQAFINPEIVIKELLRVGKKAIVTIPNFGHWKVRLNLLSKEQCQLQKHYQMSGITHQIYICVQ